MLLCLQVVLNGLLIERLGFSLLDDDGCFRAFPQACGKAITVLLANQLRLAVDNLKRTLSTS
jgi:hypothetical protein